MNTEKKDESVITSQDSNLMMFQMFTKFKEKSEEQSQAMASQMQDSKTQTQVMASQMEAISEKLSATPEVSNTGGGNKSRAKGRHPEKIERDIDYATFLQWEKSWNLYVISDNQYTLSDKQKTAIFFKKFTI